MREADVADERVAKFYFCMQQILYESLEQRERKKIEFGQQDVAAILAMFVEGNPNTLRVEVLNMQLLYDFMISFDMKLRIFIIFCS